MLIKNQKTKKLLRSNTETTLLLSLVASEMMTLQTGPS